MNYRLGQEVEFTAWVSRETVAGDPDEAKTSGKLGKGPYYHKKTYRRVWTRQAVRLPRAGVITGKRTLAEGTLNASTQDERAYLSDCNYVEVYLIATNIREKPYRVLTADITPLDL